MAKVDQILIDLMHKLDVQAPLEEFKMGIIVEKEHTEAGAKNGKYKVIPMNLVSLAKIAAVHLAEMPDYYTKLAQMEGKKPSDILNKENTKASLRKEAGLPATLLNLLGLNSVNQLLEQWDTKKPYTKTPLQKPKQEEKPPEIIDDDFFASTMLGEEAIYPDDIVREPKVPVTAAKSLLPAGVPQLNKLQEQLSETLHYLTHKLLPESKTNKDVFFTLKELKDSLEVSLLTIQESLSVLEQ